MALSSSSQKWIGGTGLVVIAALIIYLAWPRPQEYALVEGRVTLEGQPLADVQICFTPDALAGFKGASSKGFTDANGHYDLKMDSGRLGAVVGVHRVTALDVDALPDPAPPPVAPGEPAPPKFIPKESRIAAAYSISASTPLSFNLHAGRQTIDIELQNKP